MLLRDVSIEWVPDLPDTFGAALEAHGVDGLSLEHVTGGAARAGMPPRILTGTRLAS